MAKEHSNRSQTSICFDYRDFIRHQETIAAWQRENTHLVLTKDGTDHAHVGPVVSIRLDTVSGRFEDKLFFGTVKERQNFQAELLPRLDGMNGPGSKT